MAMAGCDEHRDVNAFAISKPATIYSTITENCFRLTATFITENKPFYLLVYIVWHKNSNVSKVITLQPIQKLKCIMKLTILPM